MCAELEVLEVTAAGFFSSSDELFPEKLRK
jgi:hypothetical protein